MKKWFWIVLATVIVIFDQLSKYLALFLLIPYKPIAIFPMFNFTLMFNTGAAFSFLSNTGPWHHWFFGLFNFIVGVAIVIWILRAPKEDKIELTGLSFILGGAIGNLFDRIFLGHVVDFIDVYYKQYHWPVFNLADSAICIGAILIVIHWCRQGNN